MTDKELVAELRMIASKLSVFKESTILEMAARRIEEMGQAFKTIGGIQME